MSRFEYMKKRKTDFRHACFMQIGFPADDFSLSFGTRARAKANTQVDIFVFSFYFYRMFLFFFFPSSFFYKSEFF